MNERDYNLFEMLSFATGFIIVMNWVGVSLFLKPLTTAQLIIIFSIGIAFFIMGLIFHFKKLLYISEMKNELKKE